MYIYGKSCIRELAKRYPSLYIPLCEEGEENLWYKNATLSGGKYFNTSLTDFETSHEDYIKSIFTEAGEVEIVFLKNRQDFILFLNKTVYKGVRKYVPDTIGAMMINGISNWNKINSHMEKYVSEGNTDYNPEFKRFTSDKSNFKDCLLLISDGLYSNIPAEKIGISESEWINASQKIRVYHECTHYICRKLWNEKKNIIFDEIVADCIGLFAAFGNYSTRLALLFLGLDDNGSYIGGRLEFYCDKSEISELQERILNLVHQLAREVNEHNNDEPFVLLRRIMEHGYIL